MRATGARKATAAGLGLLLGVVAIAALVHGGGDYDVGEPRAVGRRPAIRPDYSGVLVPPNIAPLNFSILEPGSRFQVRIAAGEREIVVSSSGPGIRIPAGPWRELLAANRGGEMRIRVFADRGDGDWEEFETIVNGISVDPIDPYLVYRELLPQFYIKAHMTLRQRNLESFDVTTVIDEHQFPGHGGCFNCHSFFDYRTDRYAFQVRHRRANYLFVSDGGRASLIRLKYRKPGSAYMSWHPSGESIALAMDMGYELLTPFSGAVPEETLEFVDTGGDICLYRLSDNAVTSAPELSTTDRMETHPAWSPDGRHLYFISSPQVPLEEYTKVKYDLRRIAYDPATNEWGECEVLISAEETGRSCTFPRVSPDNRFVLFGMTDRSSLALLRDGTDLYLMDLRDDSWRKLAVNSDHTDSYHAWSSNGRWIAFVSKRRDGVHGLVYFSHLDEEGRESRPFVLPQSDPAFYESYVKTFNVPEFVREPVKTGRFELGRQVTEVEKLLSSE